ncbi:hypothetical protein HYW42_00385 [Candidatus Daviesbacteria bacterium]|nr:hypothetical protein [Candidatus Daviesbacteria bacterium]
MTADYEQLIHRISPEQRKGNNRSLPEVRNPSALRLRERFCPRPGEVVQANITREHSGVLLDPEPLFYRIKQIRTFEGDQVDNASAIPVKKGEVVLVDLHEGYEISVSLKSLMAGRAGVLDIYLPQED